MPRLTVDQLARVGIGPFIEGTARDDDVGDALARLLDALALELAHVERGEGLASIRERFRWIVRAATARRRWRTRRGESPGKFQGDSPADSSLDSSGLVSELFDIVNEVLPEGYHCDAHEGDGACFGIWPPDKEDSSGADQP